MGTAAAATLPWLATVWYTRRRTFALNNKTFFSLQPTPSRRMVSISGCLQTLRMLAL